MDWKPENHSFEYYKKEKPKFLFGLLTVLFSILRHYLNYKKKFRIRILKCAITNALKKTEEEFITIYEVKIKCQIREATCGGVI